MIVVDANVVLGAFRSRQGASFAMLTGLLSDEFVFAVSPAVVLEYEALLKRPGILGAGSGFSHSQIDKVLDVICAVGTHVQPLFSVRPFLRDPDDDLYIECDFAARAHAIVTFDKDFSDPIVSALGIRAIKPAEFLVLSRT